MIETLKCRREMELLESEKIEMEKKLALADNNYNQMLEESAQKKIELLIKERGLFVLCIVLISYLIIIFHKQT